MVESISNVLSVGFKFLQEGGLDGKEAKEFTSKNMMLNIHAIFRHTIAALAGNPLLAGKFDLKDLKKALIIDMDNILHNIFINLIDYYPQAAGVGGSPRMKDAIIEINRSEDE